MLVVALGLTGCAITGISSSAVCDVLESPLQALSDALAANPETPERVGEAGADVVILGQGACTV